MFLMQLFLATLMHLVLTSEYITHHGLLFTLPPIIDFIDIYHWTSLIPFIIAVASLWTPYSSFYDEKPRANNALIKKSA